jgi:hypothetical protein
MGLIDPCETSLHVCIHVHVCQCVSMCVCVGVLNLLSKHDMLFKWTL